MSYPPRRSPLPHELSQRDRRRVGRELARLQTLGHRRRGRAAAARIVRGGLGSAASFAAAIKFKIAATLGGKLLLAALVGLGFAWPGVALGLVAVVLVAVALSEGGCDLDCGGCDLCEGCGRRNARRDRLNRLVAEREAWLATPDAPPPAPLGTTPRGLA